VRVRSQLSRRARLLRAFTFLSTATLLVPLHASASAASIELSRTRIVAANSVGMGGGVDLLGQLTIADRPTAGHDVVFVSRPSTTADWQPIGSARTGFGGWATWHVPTVKARTQYGVYYPGLRGVAKSSVAATTVHVIDVQASAPSRVMSGHPVQLAGRLTMDGRGLGAQPLHFMFRHGPRQQWHAARWDRANRRGWARIERRFPRTFQVGVRFEGAQGLAPSPLAVATVRVVQPPAPPRFVFPFQDPARAMSSGSWSEDQGVDMAYAGNACGSAAVLVAVGNGVVVQEGISGFGPTAPVLKMTSGVFAGRYVYYGHTGRVFAHVGDTVRAGQKLAEIGCGSVGYSASPHLEIGVGVAGGPTCCPAMHQTSGEMMRQLLASLS
jgi:murein DD-endopeptidase MepM/ murein hydrolase activator NlpD